MASRVLRQQAEAHKQTINTGSAIRRKTTNTEEASPTAVSVKEEQKAFYVGPESYHRANLVRSDSVQRESGRSRSGSELHRSNAVRGSHRTPSVRKPQKPSGLRTLEVPPKEM